MYLNNIIMSISKFAVKHVFELKARKLIVLTGNIVSGHISDEMYLLQDEKKLRIKINSVENVNSVDASVGLTFCVQNVLDIDKLKEISSGEEITLTMP